MFRARFFERLLLDRIRDHQVLTEHPEQAGFTPKRSTSERILGLWVLIGCRLEYRQGFFILCRLPEGAQLGG